MSEKINTVIEKVRNVVILGAQLQSALSDINVDLAHLNAEVAIEVSEQIEAAIPTLLSRIMPMLEQDEFKLRAVQTVCDTTAASREQVLEALDRAGVSYVLLHRNRDGAELLGLAARN